MRSPFLPLSFVLAVLAGCGSPKPPGGPETAKVKGVATIDGRPISAGELHFVLAGAPPKVVEIKDGAFAGEATVGANKVEAFIYAETKEAEKYGGARSKVNTVPPKYWGPNTALSAEVTPAGPNEFKFAITSK